MIFPEPPKAPAGRKVIGPRRINAITRSMGALRTEPTRAADVEVNPQPLVSNEC